MAMFHPSTFKPLIALLSLVALSGCVTPTAKLTDSSGKIHEIPTMRDSERTIDDMEMPEGAGTCEEPRSGFPLGGALTEKAMSRIVRVSYAIDLRVIFPGDPVTKDRRPGRVNIEVDETDHISKVYCG